MTTNAAVGAARPGASSVSWVVRLLPGIVVVSYLTISVLLFAYGPWLYPIYDGAKLYVFLGSAHVAFGVGYTAAMFRPGRSYSGLIPIRTLMAASLAASLLFLVPTSFVYTGSPIPNVLAALANPGAAYSSVQARLQTIPAVLLGYARILAGPLLNMLIPLTVFYWMRWNWTMRLLSGMCISGMVAVYMAMGTNKLIADTIMLVPCLLFAAHVSGGLRFTWKHKLALAGGAFIGALGFALFFTGTQASRSGSPSVGGYFPGADAPADAYSAGLARLAPTAQTGVVGLSLYLTQGYYATYLALDEPFVPTYGAGNSIFLARQVARILDDPTFEFRAYPFRLEKYGWNALVYWSSIYPWIASDVSFPGTVVVVLFIGYVFGLSWIDTIRGDNPFAVTMFAFFVIMLVYFPGNNQMLQSGEHFSAFWLSLALWLMTRRRIVLPIAAGRD